MTSAGSGLDHNPESALQFKGDPPEALSSFLRKDFTPKESERILAEI
jgi:hypothetical protein